MGSFIVKQPQLCLNPQFHHCDLAFGQINFCSKIIFGYYALQKSSPINIKMEMDLPKKVSPLDYYTIDLPF
jgi:hypothetical protein